MKPQALFTIQAELKLAIITVFLLFGITIGSGEILVSVWQEGGNFEVLKRCYFQIYPTSFFCCVMEKLLIFNTC